MYYKFEGKLNTNYTSIVRRTTMQCNSPLQISLCEVTICLYLSLNRYYSIRRSNFAVQINPTALFALGRVLQGNQGLIQTKLLTVCLRLGRLSAPESLTPQRIFNLLVSVIDYRCSFNVTLVKYTTIIIQLDLS